MAIVSGVDSSQDIITYIVTKTEPILKYKEVCIGMGKSLTGNSCFQLTMAQAVNAVQPLLIETSSDG